MNVPDTMSKKSIISLMFAITGMLLLVASLILPWWGTNTVSDQYDPDTGEKEYHYESGGGLSIASGIGLYGGGTSLYSGDYSVPALFGATTMLVIMALIFISLFITSIFLLGIGQIKKTKLPMVFGILALVFCILAPIIFMAALPGATKADEEKRAEDDDDEYEEPDHDDPTKSFFGSYEDTEDRGYADVTIKQSWGGDIGWILAFVSFGMILISFIMIIPRKEITPQQPQQPIPSQQQQPPQQPQYPPRQQEYAPIYQQKPLQQSQQYPPRRP